MPYSKGDYVTTTVSGAGARVSYGQRPVQYNNDEELIVSSVLAGGLLRVRKSSGGYVFTIAPSKVKPVTRSLGEAPEGAIDIDDPRIQWIFEDAGRLANRMGYCTMYDKLAEMLGAPGRLRKFTIEIPAPNGVLVKATVESTSRAAAKKLVMASLRGEDAPKAISA